MRVRSLLLSTSLLCAVAADTAALAQSEAIETITVTARRKAESIQNTPVAVTALDSKQLEKFFMRNMADLTRAAPGFTIEGVGALYRTSAVIFSRGIGYQGTDPAIEPAIGIAVDGLFLPSNFGGLQSMYDLGQVEMLRGPQGTLFGKNTTGGVVQVTTADPTDQYELSGLLRIGNFGRSDYHLTANVPLTDTFSARIAAMSQKSDGPFTNTYVNPVTGIASNRHTGGDGTDALRLKLKWEPNDNVAVRFTAQYFKQRQDSATGQNASVAVPVAAGGDLLANAPYNRPGIGQPGGPTDPFRISRDNDGYENAEEYYGVLNVDYRTPYGFDIVSTTGFLRYAVRTLNDFDNTNIPYFTSITGEVGAAQKMFSQEVRFQSNDDESRLNWQAGIFYYWHNWFFSGYNRILTSLPTASPLTFLQTGSNTRQNAYTIAGYGHVDYELFPDFIISGGARYSYEAKNFGRNTPIASLVPPLPPSNLVGSADWKDFTFDVGANYRMNENVMVYGKYSTGAKAGGFNSGAANLAALGPFRPETAKATEIGAKTDWFDHRLRVNLAAYWNEYGELQISAFQQTAPGSPLSSFIANSAYERARGVELEIAAIPIEHLNLSASVSYLDARYTSFKADLQYNWPGHPCRAGLPAAVLAGTADYLAGTVVDHAQQGACYLVPIRAPQWTGKFDISYDFKLGDHGTLTPHASFSFETSHWPALNNAPQGLVPTYSIVDLDLTYRDPSSRYTVSLWGKNVFNTLHKLTTNAVSNLFSINYYDNPATFGIDLSFKFGGEDE